LLGGRLLPKGSVALCCARLPDDGQGILQRVDPDRVWQPLPAMNPMSPLAPVNPHVGRAGHFAQPIAYRLEAFGQVGRARRPEDKPQGP
jgi:hypothetical protein